MILKRAEQTPLTALLLGEIIQGLDVPPGVFNIGTGFGEAGAALASHDDVDKVAFTGSTEVGKKIVDAARGNLKKVSLELGGKSPNIVFADADLEAAVAGSAGAWLFNHGQCCVAGTRLFVEDKIFDEFTQAVADFAAQAKLGPGLDPATEVGPLIDQDQVDRVTGYLRQGLADSARARAGGGRHGDTVFYVQPTVLVDVKPEFSVVREEIFGPVVVAQPFSTDDGVVRQANDTDFGLAAGVWTRDISKAHRIARRLKAGTVWVNTYKRLRHGTPLRRVQAVRLGAGTRRGRHRSLHPGQGREHPVVRGAPVGGAWRHGLADGRERAVVSAVYSGDGSLLAEARFQVLGGRQPTETLPSLRADGVPIECARKTGQSRSPAVRCCAPGRHAKAHRPSSEGIRLSKRRRFPS
nr:aldehyde dehydrogenase family protein [Streptomyces sp. 303MFCol5.2]